MLQNEKALKLNIKGAICSYLVVESNSTKSHDNDAKSLAPLYDNSQTCE